MQSKYKGIDSRDIKCCCNEPNCAETGISFDEDEGQKMLKFHFLHYRYINKTEKILEQKTKTMFLNKENTKELITALKQLKF